MTLQLHFTVTKIHPCSFSTWLFKAEHEKLVLQVFIYRWNRTSAPVKPLWNKPDTLCLGRHSTWLLGICFMKIVMRNSKIFLPSWQYPLCIPNYTLFVLHQLDPPLLLHAWHFLLVPVKYIFLNDTIIRLNLMVFVLKIC